MEPDTIVNQRRAPRQPRAAVPDVRGVLSLTAAKIAHALHGRKSGAGYMACCPAHDDREPSLSLRDADGLVLAHCHAGCAQDAVITALKDLGLWPEQEQRQAAIEAVYDYTNEAGELLYQIVRKPGKKFLQRYPDGSGGWVWKKHPHQVLYHLPEILENPIVFICEGEKDCETLRSHGFVASTAAGGAKAPWLPQFTEALRGHEVILIPDRDRAGYERVKRIARALLGNVARLVYLELEDGKDLSEWFERGHSEVELIAQLDGEEVSQ
jgi:5S rRNA maturation endonuclease (ribonuclease M5)